jgi:TRAP transporter TAXI family solute receptor
MAKKQIQLFGASGIDGTSMAYHGIDIYAGKPIKTVRVLVLYYLNYGAYVVRADSGVKVLRDLHGKRFHTGIPGSSAEHTANMVFKMLGIQPQIIFGSLADAMDMTKEGRIVGFAKFPSVKSMDSTIVDVNTQTPVRLLSFTDEEITKAISILPGTARLDIPAGGVMGLRDHGPVTTYHSAAGLFVTSELPADLVYKMMKAVMTDWQKELVPVFAEAATFHGIKDTIGAASGLGISTPLHAGVVKYFMEQGYDVPAKLLPPEWKK